MRRVARRDRRARKPCLVVVLTVAAACATRTLVPADGGAAGLQHGSPARAQGAHGVAHRSGLTGVAAVGALFTETSGKLGRHFCTASVVDSAHGDLAVTAAHCVTGKPGQIVFAPGYANGKEPYGVWPVTRVYTDTAWQSAQDQDDDVAFLRLSDASDGVPIEDITGAEELGGSSRRPRWSR